ncbi:MAG: hypothetical protein IPJ65_21950 [Archangiaceae bacterium]|nr:hypothetical protein [Archangiaceae bacterium]
MVARTQLKLFDSPLPRQTALGRTPGAPDRSPVLPPRLSHDGLSRLQKATAWMKGRSHQSPALPSSPEDTATAQQARVATLGYGFDAQADSTDPASLERAQLVEKLAHTEASVSARVTEVGELLNRLVKSDPGVQTLMEYVAQAPRPRSMNDTGRGERALEIAGPLALTPTGFVLVTDQFATTNRFRDVTPEALARLPSTDTASIEEGIARALRTLVHEVETSRQGLHMTWKFSDYEYEYIERI